MEPNWKELLAELGKNIEDAGRMMQRRTNPSKQDLTDLRDTLSMAVETVQTIRDNTFV